MKHPFFAIEPIEVDRPTPCYWDPALWFSNAPDDVSEAKRLCGTCPVQLRCRSDSIEQRERYGTWGGVSAAERKPLLPPEPDESVAAKRRSGFVPGIGSLRRLRALSANGWTLGTMSQEAKALGFDLTESALAGLRRTRSGGQITAMNADRIALLYSRLQGIEGPNPDAARQAREKGWETPSAWIGRDIDAPEDDDTEDQIGA